MTVSSLENKVAIVTGASRGLGRAAARALAGAGARVVASARTQWQLETLLADLPGGRQRHLAAAVDVSNEGQIRSLVEQTLDSYGRVDILVNNAGYNRPRPFEQVTTADVDDIIGINLRGLILCAHAVYPHMVAQQSGIIVNVGSVLSTKAVAENSIYCATKFAVLGFSRALMIEAKQDNIRVIAFLPGGMDTSWYDDRPEFDSSWLMKPDAVAEVLLHTVTAPASLVTYEIVVAPETGGSWP